MVFAVLLGASEGLWTLGRHFIVLHQAAVDAAVDELLALLRLGGRLQVLEDNVFERFLALLCIALDGAGELFRDTRCCNGRALDGYFVRVG